MGEKRQWATRVSPRGPRDLGWGSHNIARRDHSLVAEAGYPGVEAGLEGLGLQGHENTAEVILTGDPTGQVEEPGEEVLLELGPACDGGGPGGAGEDREYGDDQDARQEMPPVDLRAGSLQ